MKFDKDKFKRSLNNLGESAKKRIDRLAERGQEAWSANSPALKQTCSDWKSATEEFAKATGSKAKGSAQDMLDRVVYSSERMNKLQSLIRYQGGYYRELCRDRKQLDMLSLGGESLATLLAAAAIPDAIQAAYEAAYPDKAGVDDLADQLRSFNGDELTGFLAGIKGKLFEQQYVEYLNDENLPDGYTAQIAEAANQPGWDIAIEGPNQELIEVIQAKATDSVGYVVAALEKNPQIDVVTTDEVYSQLVMSGASESMVTNSGITNASLEEVLAGAVDTADISLNFTPPWFTMALIAFTTYKAEDLTLFQKARSAGDRTGKAYLSFILGGTLAAVTNTWWLGVVGTVASRFLADDGARRRAIFDKLSSVAKKNDEIIGKLENFQPHQA
ncbi:MAG: hypothetical protein P8R37_07760 [Opitutae bacterium]|nr:hypothetical protein [Opitutae bacterium]